MCLSSSLCNFKIFFITQFQEDQRPQRKSSYTEADRREVGSSLDCISTGDHFLNITPVAQTLRATINKWDLLKLKTSIKQRTLLIGQIGNAQNVKRYSPTPHLTED